MYVTRVKITYDRTLIEVLIKVLMTRLTRSTDPSGGFKV